MLSPKFLGGLLSDNSRGIYLDGSDHIHIEDYDIVGSTELFKDHTIARSLKLCSNGGWKHQGIYMLSGLWGPYSDRQNRGLRLRNVNMSGFDKEKDWYPCKSTEVCATSFVLGSPERDYVYSNLCFFSLSLFP